MTLRIKILGGGCANCERLEQHARQAAAPLGVAATFTKTGDPDEYRRYSLLATPGLVINDRLVVAGRVPSVAEITTLLTNVLAAE